MWTWQELRWGQTAESFWMAMQSFNRGSIEWPFFWPLHGLRKKQLWSLKLDGFPFMSTRKYMQIYAEQRRNLLWLYCTLHVMIDVQSSIYRRLVISLLPRIVRVWQRTWRRNWSRNLRDWTKTSYRHQRKRCGALHNALSGNGCCLLQGQRKAQSKELEEKPSEGAVSPWSLGGVFKDLQTHAIHIYRRYKMLLYDLYDL